MTTRYTSILALMFASSALVGCSGGGGGGGTPSYEVTASVDGEGGTIDAESRTTESGTTTTFTVTANSNYVIETVSDTCGGEAFTGGSNVLETVYTTGTVTEDCAVTATFSPAHEVTVSAGTGGSIDPTGSVWVKAGETYAFGVNAEAASGYLIDTVTGSCGEPFTGTGETVATYTTAAVTAACDVTASFKLATYSVTTQAAPGGSIAAGGTFTHGDPASFIITPASPEYVVAGVTSDCGGAFDAGTNTYSIDGVNQACTITAEFKLAEGQAPLVMSYAIKQLTFTSSEVTGATEYRLMQDIGGFSTNVYNFSQVTENVSLTADGVGTVNGTYDIAVHLFDWPDTSFKVAACNAAGCLDSNVVATNKALEPYIDAIGYVKALNPAPAVGDWFGTSVAVSGDGNTLAVGSPAITYYGPNTGFRPGRVYIYTRDGAGWDQRATLNGEQVDDMFGGGLALNDNGTVLAVGAPLRDRDDGTGTGTLVTDVGAAYVFTRDDTTGTNWTQRQYLTGDSLGAGDRFGSALALSDEGSVLAVGAPFEGEPGAAYLFSTADGWTGAAKDRVTNGGTLIEWFGRSVSLSGDGSVLAVGAARAVTDTVTSEQGGKVYLYDVASASQNAALKSPNVAGTEYFGRAVSLSDDGQTLAVGASGGDSSTVAGSGVAYVFNRGPGGWDTWVSLEASNPGADDWFGEVLALSGDGNTLLVGAYEEDGSAKGIGGGDDDGVTGAGAAYAYARVDGVWSSAVYVKASNTGADDFGYTMSLSDDGATAAVGAYVEHSPEAVLCEAGSETCQTAQGNDAAAAAGAVYLY